MGLGGVGSQEIINFFFFAKRKRECVCEMGEKIYMYKSI